MLDLGAAAGRLALALARDGSRGHRARRRSDDAARARRERRPRGAGGRGRGSTTLCADMRDFTLERPVALAIAAMNTLQVLTDARRPAGVSGAGPRLPRPCGRVLVRCRHAGRGRCPGGDRRRARRGLYTEPETRHAAGPCVLVRLGRPGHPDGPVHAPDRRDRAGRRASVRSCATTRCICSRRPSCATCWRGPGSRCVQAWGDFAGAPLEAGAERQVYRCRVAA